MNIQYYHGNKPKRKYTVAVNVLTYDDLVNKIPGSVYIEVGVSKVYKNDQYNKKIGRNVALGRKTFVEFNITAVQELNIDTLILTLQKAEHFYQNDTPIKTLTIHVNPNWQKPHLVHATI
jgi:hypothetical protein